MVTVVEMHTGGGNVGTAVTAAACRVPNMLASNVQALGEETREPGGDWTLMAEAWAATTGAPSAPCAGNLLVVARPT